MSLLMGRASSARSAMKMQVNSFTRLCVALGATVNLYLIFLHGAPLSTTASPESSSSLSSFHGTTLADGVEGEAGRDVWQARGKEVVEEGEGSNQPQAGTATMEDNRLRTTTTRQGLSSSSRLGRLLRESSWRKISKVMISLTMAVTVASLLQALRKISSMCTAKLGELKGQAAGESVPEICRTLGLAQSQGEEALPHDGKDKTLEGGNFFQKLLKTRSLSQQAMAAAVALLLISLASTAHAKRIGYGTKPKEPGYAGRIFVFDQIFCNARGGRFCEVNYLDLGLWWSMFYEYHEREIHHIYKERDGQEYHWIFRFSDDFIEEMNSLGIYKDQRYWVAYEWADQIGRGEGQVTGTKVPLILWYMPDGRSS